LLSKKVFDALEELLGLAGSQVFISSGQLFDDPKQFLIPGDGQAVFKVVGDPAANDLDLGQVGAPDNAARKFLDLLEQALGFGRVGNLPGLFLSGQGRSG